MKLGKKLNINMFLSPDCKYILSGKIIASEKSKFQKIEIMKHSYFGKILLLDRDVQLTERDEFIYHENLIHPAMLAYPRPEKVLLIGGSDGGALREVLKYNSVKEATVVDIDEKVAEISKKYLKTVCGPVFEDKRSKFQFTDGRKYIEDCVKNNKKFDVIAIDLTEPFGPSKYLYTKEFYELVSNALNDKGILTLHALSPYATPKSFAGIVNSVKTIFPYTKINIVGIPSFGFPWSFMLASKKTIDIKKIRERKDKLEMKLRSFNVSALEETPAIAKGILETNKGIFTDKNPCPKSF
jgi:spermidine synthase